MSNRYPRGTVRFHLGLEGIILIQLLRKFARPYCLARQMLIYPKGF